MLLWYEKTVTAINPDTIGKNKTQYPLITVSGTYRGQCIKLNIRFETDHGQLTILNMIQIPPPPIHKYDDRYTYHIYILLHIIYNIMYYII